MAEDRSGPHRRPRRIFTRPEMCLQARTAPIKGAASRWRGLCGNDPCKSIPDDRQASKSANGIGAKVHSRFAAELVGRLVGKLVARRNLSLTKLRHPVILFGDPGHRANLRSARLDSSRNSLFRPPRTGRPFFMARVFTRVFARILGQDLAPSPLASLRAGPALRRPPFSGTDRLD